MRRRNGSIAGPVALIAVGLLFLLHAITPSFRLGEVLGMYWPYLLILWGLIALVEVCFRFMRSGPVPTNGVSGAGWVLAIFIILSGMAVFEVQRPNNWWRQIGFNGGIEAFGQERSYTVDTQRKTVGATPHVVFENFRGDAKIVGVATDEIAIGGRKLVRAFDIGEADKANADTPAEIFVDGNTIVIRCHQDRANSRSTVTTNLEVSVPKGASIEASGSRGDFDVSAIDGDVQISSGKSSEMRFEDVGGSITVDARGSNLIRASNVKGTVDLRGRGSDIELQKIAGQVTIDGDYSGTVSLRDLAKPVRVESMRTRLDARQVLGEIRMDRGSLNAQNVVGPVKVTAHSTDITFDGFTDRLELTVDRGDVELRPGRAEIGPITVHARSGNIELALPQAASFSLNANTVNGEVDNQFGDKLRENSAGHGARLEGSVGSGPDVNLETQRGSITIRKSATQTTSETKASFDPRVTRAERIAAHFNEKIEQMNEKIERTGQKIDKIGDKLEQ